MAHFTGGEPGGVAKGRRDSTAKQERQRLSMDPQSVLVSEGGLHSGSVPSYPGFLSLSIA